MIIKSFFRKKISKIYIFIFFIIFSFLYILNWSMNKYINYANEDYNGSYILLISDIDINLKLKKISNIKTIQTGIETKIEDEQIFLIFDDNLSNNEIMIPILYKLDYDIGDKIFLTIDNVEQEFIIKGFSDETNSTIYYISNQIINNNKNNYVYKLDLKNWTQREKTIKKINTQVKENENFEIYHYQQKKSNMDYDIIVNFFVYLILAIIIIFCFLLFNTIVNILEDETQINKLYNYLGFHKRLIIIISVIKILSLLLLSFLISNLFCLIFDIIF